MSVTVAGARGSAAGNKKVSATALMELTFRGEI